MKIIHIPSGYDPSANEYVPERSFRLSGCVTMMLALLCAGLIGYILLNNNPKSAAAARTPTIANTNTLTPTYPAPTAQIKVSSTATITDTPTDIPTGTLTPTIAPSKTPTTTPTSTPTQTFTRTPSPTRRPRSSSSSSSSSGASADNGGCGPCSGSVSGGSQTIGQGPSGPGQTNTEQNLYTPSATWIALSPAPTEIK